MILGMIHDGYGDATLIAFDTEEEFDTFRNQLNFHPHAWIEQVYPTNAQEWLDQNEDDMEEEEF